MMDHNRIYGHHTRSRTKMETKFESRQHQQFPATFPETFKDFFSMINEDEDHHGFISNILEDKIIPRQTTTIVKTQCRCCGNSRCCNSSTNFGRSNSFRVNRGSGNEYCRNKQHCCVHQNNQQISIQQQQQQGGGGGGGRRDSEIRISNFSDDENFKNKLTNIYTNYEKDSNQQQQQQQQQQRCTCDNCMDPLKKSHSGTGTTSQLTCLLRHKTVHSRSSSFRGKRKSSIGGTSASIYLEPSAESSSSSSSPAHMPFINENNSLSCKSNDINRPPPKSPVAFTRRRASIALTEMPIDIQTSRSNTKEQNEQNTWGQILNDPQSRDKFSTSNSKSPMCNYTKSFHRTIEGSSIRETTTKQRQRQRTSSMPAENRKPRLADTRRSAIHCADIDMDYYRLRSFSITSHGICNLGDSLKSRRSRSITSVTSTATSNSGKDRNNSNASTTIGELQQIQEPETKKSIPAYKVAMLGGQGVGKTALTYQFTTSEYICAYDLSLDDDYGQKTVSVLLDGQETDLEIIDHPACEMSPEAFCSTYNIDIFVVVYSVVDRKTFKAAEKILHYLKDNEMMLTRGVILVGNKTDLERHREVQTQNGRKLAKEVACKFIETSSGLDHNVDELLVGVVAQVKLNPKRLNNLTEKQRLSLSTTILRHRRSERPGLRMSKISSKSSDSGSEIKETANEFAKVKTKTINKRDKNSKVNVRSDDDEDDEDDDDDVDDHVNNISGNSSTNNSSDDDDDDDCNTDVFTHESPSCSSTTTQTTTTTTSKITKNLTSKSSTKSSTKQQKSYDTCGGGGSGSGSAMNKQTPKKQTNLPADEKSTTKITTKTKLFLTSFLKFKKSLRVKRRNSNSCSDLFAI